MERLVPVLGLAVLVGACWLLSDRRRAIDWRIPAWGIGLQFLFGVLALKTSWGRSAFDAAGAGVTRLLEFAATGAEMVFGPALARGEGIGTGADGRPIAVGFVFAFRVLPSILFFSALMSVLYHLRILQVVVRALGTGMQRLMRVSGAEAFSAAANIFVGQTEAPFVVRPFLAKMTSSEIFCVMTGGFATIAGGVMAAYIGMFQTMNPGFGAKFAGHLIAASVMSAPAALVCAKMMRPETEEPVTRGGAAIAMERPARNVVDAAVVGTRDGLVLAANVGAMLIAFTALIALVNACFGGVGGWFGRSGWTLEGFLGLLFRPLAWLMGAPWDESGRVGEFIGMKTVLNEYVAYQRLAPVTDLSERSMVVATYALCGFSNFASIAIQVGGIGAMVPEQRPTLARHGLPAMVAGSIACFMTACIAALLL
jgi:CNT family concentrative nucleoside transporter